MVTNSNRTYQSSYLHYISITSFFAIWKTKFSVGHAEQGNTLVCWLPQTVVMRSHKNTDLITGASGRVGPTDLWVWDCESLQSRESWGRVAGQRRCITPMMLVTAADHSLSSSLLAAHTGPFLTLHCFIHMPHATSKVCLSNGIKEFVVNDWSSISHL